MLDAEYFCRGPDLSSSLPLILYCKQNSLSTASSLTPLITDQHFSMESWSAKAVVGLLALS